MNLTLAQARAMRWPFRNPRQPMGQLLDQGAITAHDLQRASRAAYSPRFKAACLLLLHEMLPIPDTAVPAITRRGLLLDQPPSPLIPQLCPICNSKLRISGKCWECVTDRAHYWRHRANRLRAARQRWIESLPPDEQQYRADIWQTASDLDAREQFLLDHALKYPAGS